MSNFCLFIANRFLNRHCVYLNQKFKKYSLYIARFTCLKRIEPKIKHIYIKFLPKFCLTRKYFIINWNSRVYKMSSPEKDKEFEPTIEVNIWLSCCTFNREYLNDRWWFMISMMNKLWKKRNDKQLLKRIPIMSLTNFKRYSTNEYLWQKKLSFFF